MRYHIAFANNRVGQSDLGPFEVETPDQLGSSARVADLSRQIRSKVTNALTFAPAPGASDARGVIEQNTQVIVQLAAGEGAAYYGTTTLGRFMIRQIS